MRTTWADVGECGILPYYQAAVGFLGSIVFFTTKNTKTTKISEISFFVVFVFFVVKNESKP
jgi:hypothetical protein